MADAHFLVLVVESTPFGEYFGLLVFVLGQGGEPGSDRVAVSTCDFVWSKPVEEHLPNQVTENQYTFDAVKESEFLRS